MVALWVDGGSYVVVWISEKTPKKVKSSAFFTGYIIKSYIDLNFSLPTGANPGEW